MIISPFTPTVFSPSTDKFERRVNMCNYSHVQTGFFVELILTAKRAGSL